MSDLVQSLARDGAAAFQRPEQRREELSRDLVASAYLRGDFVLSSGQVSDFYFDKYLFVTKPTVLRRAASMLAERVPPGITRIAGPELGAVPLAAALSLETGIPFVIVRKQGRSYGAGGSVEGELHPGEHVLLLEDVVSTGTRVLAAAQVLVDAGAVVDLVLSVVDREQGAAAATAAAGYPLDALFRLSELALPGRADHVRST